MGGLFAKCTNDNNNNDDDDDDDDDDDNNIDINITARNFNCVDNDSTK